MAELSRSLTDRLRRVTAACPDPDALSEAVFRAVAHDLPFSFACLATTDPATGLITTAYKSAPLPVGDEEFAAAEYGRPDLNQFAEIAERPVPVGVLSVDTGGHNDRCLRLRDYMTPMFGFVDELRLVCRSRGVVWGVLAFYRSTGQPWFTEADGRLLGAVHEVLAEGIQRTLFSTGSGGSGARVPVVLIVDGAQHLSARSAAADELIDELGGWDNGALPANVLAVAASARRSEQPASTRVRSRSGGWLTLQAMVLDGTAGERSVVVSVDATARAAVGEMTIAARGLTAREQDVVALVREGASTTIIADTLFISANTVQDHLKSIFGKLGVRSRRELIAQLASAPAGRG